MTPLEILIRTRIAAEGPMPVAEYMALALGHPEHGYYMKGDPFGTDGDFITAPEIGQVFGELIGLWSAVTWQQMGMPDRTILIECGPGRGTLMNDLLRAAGTVPAFARTIEVHLVETSPALRDRQAGTLSGIGPVWHDTLDTVPDGPSILIANEFIDALPIRQIVRDNEDWAERCVGVAGGALRFVTSPVSDDLGAALPNNALPGDIFEFCPAAAAFIDQIAARFTGHPGAALFVDYGYARRAAGETLQAVRDHGYADPLTDPGEADITAHVDFGSLAAQAASLRCAVFGPVSQAAFLRSLGIVERTTALLTNARPEQAQALQSATQRLIDPAAMGDLFKALVVAHAGAAAPAGFETQLAPGHRQDD
jgi:NADH dehydrogenase [ubiquinone] 1 alpha subcomplex assembly factor 7